MDIMQPLGIRNNNPGNIEHNENNQWNGASQVQTHSRFVQFIAPEWGIRAIFKILASYRRRGKDTVAEIISTWAPANDNNDTGAYIEHVARKLGLNPFDVVPESLEVDLVKIIILHENGKQPYSDALIYQAKAMANG